jgi:anti-sigma-K factor RskA
MSENDHKRWSEDLAAHMLGALEPAQASDLERHLEGCERCREEMRWLQPALQSVSESVQRLEPPPELRARVLAEARADAAAPGAEAPGASQRRRGPAWLRGLGSGALGWRPAAALAAAALAVVAIAGYEIGSEGGDGGQPPVTTFSAGEAPGVVARVVNEGDGGSLHLANVRQIPDGKVLQAWVQRDGEVEPVEALFVPDHDGRASTEMPAMDGVEVVMVTAEPKGGSEEPTLPPLVTIRVPS